ncbi:EAL domain-containing protein [Xanthomonadaceae bacterium XH05]|nr:EAL domain-containing protein [Xanthomonadaceae bacterium XH05]
MQSQVDLAIRPFRSPAFAAFHAQRLHELRGRIAHLCTQAWDVNAAWLVRQDIQALATQVAHHDPEADTSALLALHAGMDAALAQPALPDTETRDSLLALFSRIDTGSTAPQPRLVAVRHSENERMETPPPGFWRRWTGDAPPLVHSRSDEVADGDDAAEPASDPGHIDIDMDAIIASGRLGNSGLDIVQERIAPHVTQVVEQPRTAGFEPPDDFVTTDAEAMSDDYDWNLETPAVAPPPERTLDAFWEVTATAPPEPPPPTAPAPPSAPPPVFPPSPTAHSTPIPAPMPPRTTAPTPAPPLQPELTSGQGKRIYHLTESGELACELDQRLEQLGYELELLESSDELKEVLGALTPNLVIVDAEFQSSLESIASVLRTARLRASDPIRLLVLCESDTMEARLSARRAGADALMFGPKGSDEVIARIEQMLHTPDDNRFRVLIVEDDRAQGMFAESILRNAGMEAEVVEDGLKVMEAMQRFQPDLVLMDLYMPNCDGAELTALIREHDEFLHTPIVFLSGESDQDKHYEALSAGGDDFLSKPIRPKYLIATVNNRVRRARAIRQRSVPVVQPEPFDSGTGLHFRAAMLEQLEQALVESEPTRRHGGVLFVGIENIPSLRQRLGLTTVEELLEDVAQFVVSQLGSGTMACRYGDACFLVFDAQAEPPQLRANAERLRDAIAFNSFDTPKEQVTLDVVMGVTDLRHPFADASAVLNAAEHASRAPQEATAPSPVAPKKPDAAEVARIVALLGDAMENNRLDLDYQPIVALQGGEQAQYQTLLRLHQPDNSRNFTAGEIIPVLRAQGRLPEFDRWVLSRALDVAASRMAIAKPVTFFVNQSIETLCQPDYADWLVERVQTPAQVGESLVVEINVDEIGLQLDAVHRLCNRLVMQGARFCLSRYRGSEEQDSMLNVLPTDLVKIAPDMVARLGSSETRAAFGALVERMHERAVGVIAPRVEDTRTAAVLWMSGIDYIQGNLVQLAGRSLDFDFNAAVL